MYHDIILLMTKFTKDAIKQEFIELLKVKPLNQITVKELVDATGINRNTFYYHYRDLSALVEEILFEATDKIISENPSPSSIEDCLSTIIDFAEENHNSIVHLYHSMSRIIYEKYLWKLCHRVVDTYWELARPKTATDEDATMITNLYSCACFGLAMHWIDNGMDYQKARIDAHRIGEIMVNFRQMSKK